MNNHQLQTAIGELKDILGDMKAIWQWHKLKQLENTQESVSNLRFYDTNISDLNEKYSQLLFVSSQVHMAINKSNLSPNELKVIKKELIKIELQAFYLGSGVNIY